MSWTRKRIPAVLCDWPRTAPTTLPTRETRPVWPASWLVLRERVAVALAVGGAHEGRDDVDVPVGDLAGLAPEIREAEVDVELEKVDPRGPLRHERRVGTPSDGRPLVC